MELSRRRFLTLAAGSTAAVALPAVAAKVLAPPTKVILPEKTIALPEQWADLDLGVVGAVLIDTHGRIVAGKAAGNPTAVLALMGVEPNAGTNMGGFHMVFATSEVLDGRPTFNKIARGMLGWKGPDGIVEWAPVPMIYHTVNEGWGTLLHVRFGISDGGSLDRYRCRRRAHAALDWRHPHQDRDESSPHRHRGGERPRAGAALISPSEAPAGSGS